MKVRKSVFDLQPGDVLGEDLFGFGRNRVLIVPKGLIIRDNECEALKLKLQAFGINEVLVELPDDELAVPSLNDIRKKVLSFLPVISSEVRERGLNAVRRVAETGRIDLKEIDEVVDGIIEEVVHKGEVVFSLYALRSYDDYTFVHSVNVAMLTALFAMEFAMERGDLRAIVKGALMHDLGKLRISYGILNKPGPLCPEEFEEIKKHPLYGVEMALSSGEKEEGVLSIIAQHHEWFSGRGYPKGLMGDKIAFGARIVAVVDVFDALTTDRVYKPRMLAHDAVSRMLQEGAIHFAPGVLSRFLSKFGIYPVGSIVKLSDGKIGVVSRANPLSPIRPIVRVLYDEYGAGVEEPYEIDLSSSDLFIKDVLADLSKGSLYQ